MKIKKSLPSSREINRSFNIATSFSDAKRWDILQQISLTPEQRQRAAKELKQRVFGKHAPDVRALHAGIGLKQLIKNKAAVKRHRDCEDLEFLYKIAPPQKKTR
jgi:hypothetical protein